MAPVVYNQVPVIDKYPGGGGTPSAFVTMCEHDFKGKGPFLGPRHGPARALEKRYLSGKFGGKGVHS